MPRPDAVPSRGGIASLVVALLGLAVSIYLTIEHYSSSTSLACPETGAINCQKVTTSSWSHVGPIPVAVLGVVFFAVMAVLCLPPLWRLPQLMPLRIAGAVVGVVVALYLVWVELFRVNAICLWCMAAHLCSLALLGTVLWGASAPRRVPG